MTLSPAEKRAIETVRTSDVAAYDYYLRGKEFFYRSRSLKNLEFARQMFSQAIDIDPRYAPAHAGLAGTYSYLFDYHKRDEVILRLANESSERAVELEPELAEAHASRGLALSLTNRILGLQPEDPTTLYNAACNFALAGDLEQGIVTLDKSVDAGFSDKEWVQQDSDLDSLRDDPRFDAILERVKPGTTR